MSAFQYGSATAVKKFRDTRALEVGEVRVAIYSNGNMLFKKIGHLVNGEAWVVWLGERHRATKVGQVWRLDAERVEAPKPEASAEDNAFEWGEP